MSEKQVFIFGAGYSGKAFARANAGWHGLRPTNTPTPNPSPQGGGELAQSSRDSAAGIGESARQRSLPLVGRGRVGVPLRKNLASANPGAGAATIFGTTRSAEKFGALRQVGIAPLLFDGALTPEIGDALEKTTHLAISVAPEEAGDPVLNAARRAIAQMPALEWIGYLSTVGVYGNYDGAWVDESAACRPVSKRSAMRVAAEQDWLELGGEIGKPVAILRLSGIYGPGRNALVNLENGTARRLVKPDQVFNRIHCDDIAGALWHLIGGNISGIFNVTDDEPAPPQDVVTYAASLMDVEPPPEIPFETAQLSPMARSFYGENKRVANKAIKAAGYRFRFPDYRQAFDRMWADGSWRDGEPRSPIKRA